MAIAQYILATKLEQLYETKEQSILVEATPLPFDSDGLLEIKMGTPIYHLVRTYNRYTRNGTQVNKSVSLCTKLSEEIIDHPRTTHVPPCTTVYHLRTTKCGYTSIFEGWYTIMNHLLFTTS